MPYREKTAWLSLFAMLAAFVPYFALAASRSHWEQMPDLPQLGRFAAATILQVIILVVGNIYLRLASREDAVVPPDERDREIERRAVTWAYYVLMAGMILVGFIMPFTTHGWGVVNSAILVVVAAEAVHYGGIAFSYRTQS